LPRLVGEPPGEFIAASITSGRWTLILAGRLASWAVQPDVEVIVVPPPGTQLLEPRCPGERPTQGAFDLWMDEDPSHHIELCGPPQKVGLAP
jgi:hypothetical protein